MGNPVKKLKSTWELTARNAWKFTLIFVVVGIGLLITSAALGISTLHFLRNAAFSEGMVEKLELKPSGRSGGGHVYAPIVTFTDLSGQTRTFTEAGSNPAGFKTGQPVHVAYIVSDITTAHIVSFRTLWLLPTVFGVLGIVFVLLGSFATWKARKLHSA